MRRTITALGVVLLVGLAAFTTTRVHVVEQWALYTSNGPSQPLRLFLEPFPAQRYCQYDADQVTHHGGRAQCRSRVSLTLDDGPSNRLLWTFITEWGALCGSPVS